KQFRQNVSIMTASGEFNENEDCVGTDKIQLKLRERSGTILRLQRIAATRAEYSKQPVSEADNNDSGGVFRLLPDNPFPVFF
ncbi:MAG: hypothetical protein O3B68_21720, partial [Planctomycetota bacterium]|nr:hypothetical protein [Planctomycetota bacterium]